MRVFIYTLCSCLWLFNGVFYWLYCQYGRTVAANAGQWCATPVVAAEGNVTYLFFFYVPYLILAVFFTGKAWNRLKSSDIAFFCISYVVAFTITIFWTAEITT